MGKDVVNILCLIDQIESAAGGTEQNLGFLLHSFNSPGWSSSLAVLRCSRGFEPRSLHPDARVLGLSSFSSPTAVFSAVKSLRQIIKKERIDIIHTFFSDSELLAVLASGFGNKVTVVGTRRNLGYWHSPRTLLRSRLVSRFVPNYLANCEAAVKANCEVEGLSEAKFDVIYNPVNLARLRAGQKSSLDRRALGIPQECQMVGMVANIRPVKDFDTFLKAAAIVAAEKPGVRFVVVGSRHQTEYWQHVQTLTSQLGLSEVVTYLPEEPNPTRILSAFDVAILSSHSEGLSNSLIEYGGAGLPVVATNVGGNSEVVQEEKTGYLVPAGDHESLASRVIKLLDCESLRKAFGEAAEKFVRQRFDQENITEQYRDYYRKLVGKNPR